MSMVSNLVMSTGIVTFIAGASLAAWAAVTVAGGVPPKGHVTGIGGVFFKAKDPKKLSAWYREHLGFAQSADGINFFWRLPDAPNEYGRTVWALFPQSTEYFGTGPQQMMINYRVDDLEALLARLKTEGVEQAGKMESYDYGKFAWIIDAEGNRIELWQPLGVDTGPAQAKASP